MPLMMRISAVAFAGALLAAAPAFARSRHLNHAAPRQAVKAPSAPVSSFYPETIEGGVTGNLAFNNQIRKLRDPLNANGAGR